MPTSDSKIHSRCLCITLLLVFAHGVQASAPDWFGPACVIPLPQQAAEGNRQLYLHVFTEPQDAGSDEIFLITADGRVWASRESLMQWRLRLPTHGLEFGGQPWYALNQIDGLRFRYDTCSQQLWLDRAAAQPLSQFDMEEFPRSPVMAAQPGAFLNLDMQYQHAPGAVPVAGLGQLGVFNAYGYGGTTLLADSKRLVRLDSNWIMDDPTELNRLSIGDGITRAGNFGHPLYFGGVQWGRAFSLRPGLVTFPQPSLLGTAALPSSVDVYVNQTLRAHQDVPAGPFELNQVPVVTGQGDVQLVVRDLLGREQVITSTFYSSPQLLRSGLNDYSAELGFLRNRYGLASDDYGALFSTCTFRHGFSETLTGEARAELARGHELLAASAAALLPKIGEINAGISGSGGNSGAGVSALLGFERIAASWSLSAEGRWASSGFEQLGDGTHSPLRSATLHLGIVPHPQGSLSIVFLRQQFRDGQNLRIAGFNYSLRLGHEAYVSFAVNDTLSAGRDRSYILGYTRSFGDNINAGVQHEFDAGQSTRNRFGITRSASGPLGVSWQAAADDGADYRRAAGAQWSAERGIASVAAAQTAEGNDYRIGYSSGVALLDGGVFWTRPVTGSFAVVELPQTPDVHLYSNEHDVGRTDSNGRLLIPDLRAYEPNNLRIEDADLPMNRDVTQLARQITPPAMSGVVVSFPLRITTGYSVHLRRADGSDVPAGARLKVAGVEEPLPMGFNGIAFIAGNLGPHVLEASWPGGHCRALVNQPVVADDVPAVMELICKEVLP